MVRCFEETKYKYGTPKFKKVYREDGTLADKQEFLIKEVINNTNSIYI